MCMPKRRLTVSLYQEGAEELGELYRSSHRPVKPCCKIHTGDGRKEGSNGDVKEDGRGDFHRDWHHLRG